MVRTFKILSLLLSYPCRELQEAAPEFTAVLDAEGLLFSDVRAALAPLIEELGAGDLYDLQERYVDLFDRTRALALHLFEHIHGESRDRGQALVDLMALYERHGFAVKGGELPDFLPLFLEFLAHLDLESARELIAQPLHIVSALKERHARVKSPYVPVFAAIETLAEWRASEEDVAPLLTEPIDDPDDLGALDATWEETAVTFGPDPAGACGRGGPGARS